MGRRSEESLRAAFLPEWAALMADNHFRISTIAKMAKMGAGTAIGIMTDPKANFKKNSKDTLVAAIKATSHKCPTCKQAWPEKENEDAVVRDPRERGDKRTQT